jgi:RimJ/RimL family protein N-acetyltransferase
LALPWRSRVRTIGLASGAVICVRLIRAADKPALVDAFGRLGDESRYRRFLGSAPSLNDRVLTYLTEVDHRNHSALIALEPHERRVIAVARYVRHPDAAGSAEIAVTVVDEWQGRGVGRVMLSLLIERATHAGFESLSASVLATNRPMLVLLRSHGFLTTCVDACGGVVELERGLATTGMGRDLAQWTYRRSSRVAATPM